MTLKHMMVAIVDRARAGLRLANRREVKVLGFIFGILMIATGMARSASAFDLQHVLTSIDTGTLFRSTSLVLVANSLSAFAWSYVSTSLLPGARRGSAFRNYLLTLPLKYLPGSIWNHVGRAAWFGRTRSAVEETPMPWWQTGAFAVVLDLAILLWSGLVTVLGSGALSARGTLFPDISPGVWLALLVASLAMSFVLPWGASRIAARKMDAANDAIGRDIPLAIVLQCMAWLASANAVASLAGTFAPMTAAGNSVGIAMAALFVGIFAGLMAIPVPNGIGVREGAMALMYSTLAGSEVGFTVGLLHRLIVMLSDVALFGLFGAITFVRNRIGMQNSPSG